jgi:hypothetical protein
MNKSLKRLVNHGYRLLGSGLNPSLGGQLHIPPTIFNGLPTSFAPQKKKKHPK